MQNARKVLPTIKNHSSASGSQGVLKVTNRMAMLVSVPLDVLKVTSRMAIFVSVTVLKVTS